MKIEVCIEQGQDPMEALNEVVKKVKGISSIKELRKLQEELSAEGYGVPEDMMEKEEESEESDVTEKRVEGVQDMTPDDKAEKESKEKRIKNSSHPTIVGRMMK